MNTPAWQDLLTDVVWKTTLLLAVAFLLSPLLRRHSAARRYPLWLAAVGAAICLPMLAALLPAWHVLPPAAQVEIPLFQAEPEPPSAAGSSEVPPAMARPQASAQIQIPKAPEKRATSDKTPAEVDETQESPLVWPVLALGIWMAGAALMLGRLLLSVRGLTRLKKRCRVIPWEPEAGGADTEVLDAVRQAAQELRLNRLPQVLEGPPEAVPMVWGLLHTCLLLPAGHPAWPQEKRRAVLLHELAHLKRRDPLALWAGHGMRALHWFNPLAWLTLHRLCADQERACDDTVLRHGVRPSDYAQHLLDLSRLRCRGWRIPGCALAMARNAPVEDRVTAILDGRQSREAPTRRWSLLVLATGLCAALPLAMLQAALEKPSLRGRLLDRHGRVLAESTPQEKRRYPLRGLAAHMLGYTGRTNPTDETPQGRYGLEKKLDETLRQGLDTRLTLDARLQSLAEQELAQGKHPGAVVMLDTTTGDVLAMASWPTFDPGVFVNNISFKDWDNLVADKSLPLLGRAFATQYPPGSSFHLAAAVAALAQGKKGTVYNCLGSLEVNGRLWREGGPKPHGLVDLGKALSQRCPTYFHETARRLDATTMHATLQALGFGSAPGLGLDHEQAGQLDESMMAKTEETWRVNTALGQGGLLVTPAHMAHLASHIVNNGRAPRPRLVAGPTPAPMETTLHLTEEEWALLRRAMRTSVTSGLCQSADGGPSQIAAVAAKTAWRSSQQRHLHVMCGFAPYEQPKVAFAIFLEGHPQGNGPAEAFCGPMVKRLIEGFLALPADGSGEVKPTPGAPHPTPVPAGPAPSSPRAKMSALQTPLEPPHDRRWALAQRTGDLADLPEGAVNIASALEGQGFPRPVTFQFRAPAEEVRAWLAASPGPWKDFSVASAHLRNGSTEDWEAWFHMWQATHGGTTMPALSHRIPSLPFEREKLAAFQFQRIRQTQPVAGCLTGLATGRRRRSGPRLVAWPLDQRPRLWG